MRFKGMQSNSADTWASNLQDTYFSKLAFVQRNNNHRLYLLSDFKSLLRNVECRGALLFI